MVPLFFFARFREFGIKNEITKVPRSQRIEVRRNVVGTAVPVTLSVTRFEVILCHTARRSWFQGLFSRGGDTIRVC